MRRQRWRCTQPDGSRHNFTSPVVRTLLKGPGECDVCEQHLETYQGPGVAKRYQFAAAQIATALEQVGRGMTYTDAATRAQMATPRNRGVYAQLVGNWVEVFGPVIASQFAETRRPATITVDAQPMHANQPGGMAGVVFTVVVAYGYALGDKRGRLIAAAAIPGAMTRPKWAEFLASKDGWPSTVITDHDRATLAGIGLEFPSAAVRLCRWHLLWNLSSSLHASGTSRRSILGVAAETATNDLDLWKDFTAAVAATSAALPLGAWVAHNHKLLSEELTRGPQSGVLSNGAAENALTKLSGSVTSRAFCFRNAERTNRLLELMRLHLNRVDDRGRYAAAIREHLEATNGALAHQLKVKDPYGQPSLR